MQANHHKPLQTTGHQNTRKKDSNCPFFWLNLAKASRHIYCHSCSLHDLSIYMCTAFLHRKALASGQLLRLRMGHSVSTQPIFAKVPRCPSPMLPKKFLKLNLISIKACQILGCDSEYFWRYSLSNFLFCITFKYRSETCYTD